MAVTLDISDDYAIFDNPESVTVTLKRASGNDTATVDNALRGALSRDQVLALGGSLMADHCTWFIPNDQLISGGASRVIKPKDTIAPSGEVWTVSDAKMVAAGGSKSGWQCWCVKER